MRLGTGLALAIGLVAGMAQAEGLERSSFPKPRPAKLVAAAEAEAVPMQMTVATAGTMGITRVLRPRPRPEGLVQVVAQAVPAASRLDPDSIVELTGTVGPSVLRPRARPEGLEKAFAVEPGKPRKSSGWGIFKAAATRTPPSEVPVLPKKGSVCGDPSIRGQQLSPIVGKIKSCGIDEPVEITQVAGVKLSQPATVECETALALKDWIENGLQPSFASNPVVQIQIAGSYVCRPRNNVRGNKISEHGRGKALDISGFVLADGDSLSIIGDYRKVKPIKAAHKAACGIFGTTLGPGSDGHHEDHLHFDVAAHSNGAYCR